MNVLVLNIIQAATELLTHAKQQLKIVMESVYQLTLYFEELEPCNALSGYNPERIEGL